jgi:hypothetical protein
MAPWAQDPPERPVRFAVPPLGLHSCGCLEGGGSLIHMGIMHSRYEGSFSSPCPAGSLA